jgi:hypothetical protein
LQGNGGAVAGIANQNAIIGNSFQNAMFRNTLNMHTPVTPLVVSEEIVSQD